LGHDYQNKTGHVGTARFRLGSGPWNEGQYSNFSTTGCVLLTDHSGAREGAMVWIKIADLAIIPAQVEWASHGRVAIEFATPLHVVVVDQIRRQAG
jgi:hypothetical protein